MQSEELISVIIPVYNVADDLKRCVDSLLNQTYPHLDIMLIDDGFTDDSGKICDEYAQADPRVRVTHFPTNCGVAFVRNFGVEWAQGDYFNFVDSDDWVVPEYIENLYQTLTSHQADIAISGFTKYRPSNAGFYFFDTDFLVDDYELPVKEILTNLKTYPDQIVMILNMICGKLFRKAVFNQISFPVGHLYEDSAIIYKLYLTAAKVVYARSNQYYYQMTDGSITHRSLTATAILSNIHNYEEQLSLLAFNGFDLQNYRYDYLEVLKRCLQGAQDLNNEALVKYIQSKLAVLN